MKKIILATHNKDKIREVGEIFPDCEVIGVDSQAEETETTFSGNALIKARAVAKCHQGAWVMADDSGLSVDALNGEPGVRSARYAGEDGNVPANNALLLKNLQGVEDRRAHFACAIALITPDGSEKVFEGRCYGKVALAPSGKGGFGYDPLFIPNGYEKSFGELTPEEKNAISHRGRALASLKETLAKEFSER